MKRKPKRSRLKPRPLLWALLTVNVVAGSIASPITSLVRARIDGAPAHDRQRLADVMRSMQDEPCAFVNAREIETAAMAAPDVRSAELRRNPFGHALLVVRYRRPVARVRNTNNLALTIDGVVYPSPELPPDLPVVDLPKNAGKVLFTIVGTWRPRSIAWLAAKARDLWPTASLSIDVDDAGSVCLNMGSGRVVLGSPNDLDQKLGVLEERLRANPTELQDVAVLNLSAPENPSIVRKKPEKQ